MTKFLKKHWIDVLVILAVAALLVLLAVQVSVQNNFPKKWGIFKDYFITNNGYKMLLNGMKNTALIAVFGLGIGIVIGTLIAVVKVIPPYKNATYTPHTFCA